ncbi:nucleotidyltransferase family protein [Dyella sp. C11]|uniref:nucleotidyltransferase family protein n=1 Tax=Dyella sp. C11 TaxID=2126991 RepID=UPI000D655FA7|nr:nucleotidyltransferase family protein [Dyella sp. C11]
MSEHDTLPPLATLKAGLQRTTEALANELGNPTGTTPGWTDLEWRLAAAVAAAHGVAPLLSVYPRWQNPSWSRFLESQYEHVAQRHQRTHALLARIDADARAAGIALVALKGSALHALGIYTPGERPMADIDLLVRDADMERAGALLEKLGYGTSFNMWKHRVYKPCGESPTFGLGEHRDTPINIELHTRIQERLPVATVDITDRIYPRAPVPGIHAYPSTGALMSHLLLHAAGNLCSRSIRLIHLNDISLLASRMVRSDWHELWGGDADVSPWWALPPLQLVSRYYPDAVPSALLYELAFDCHALLRTVSRHRTLTQWSCSELWLHAWSGFEWARTTRERVHYIFNRVRPSREAQQERDDMIRTQLWLQGAPWVRTGQMRRVLTWLTHPVPRMDTLYVLRAALGSSLAAWS